MESGNLLGKLHEVCCERWDQVDHLAHLHRYNPDRWECASQWSAPELPRLWQLSMSGRRIILMNSHQQRLLSGLSQDFQ